MKARACPFPNDSALQGSFVASADHVDAFLVPLSDPERSLPEIFNGIFAHRPPWLRAILATRNVMAKACGLETTPIKDTLKPRLTTHPEVGGTLGGWNVYALEASELIVGRDNPHMDFRVSISKADGRDTKAAIVATVCKTKNAMGRTYLAAILPFHTRGLQLLLNNAHSAGRL
jgi:hypothetical protein